jgi:hypothetical protein
MSTPKGTNEALPDLAGWARRKLAVAENATARAGHATILRDLATASFVPATDWHEAFEIICRPARGRCRSGRALWDEEARVRTDVEAFATEFFNLGPSARRDRWEALARQCQVFPRLAARLEGLEAGLDVEVASVSLRESQLQWLGEQAAALFILRPPERAARRQTLLAEVRNQGSSLEKVARQFQRRFPALASLEPDFIGRLASWSKIEKSLRKAAKRQRAGTRSGSSGTSRSGAGLGWVGVLIAMAVIRGLSSLSHTSAPTNYSVPSYPAPQSNSWNAGRVGVPPNKPYYPAPQVLSWPNNRPGIPPNLQAGPWNGSTSWEPGVPGALGDENPFQAGAGSMPVPKPGEPSHLYSQRLAEWARQQSNPFTPATTNGGMRRHRVETPANPASPQSGVSPSGAPDFNPWDPHPRPASASVSHERP